MKKIIGLTFALIILISLVGALAYIVPVRGIVTGAIIGITPTTVSPGAPLNATLDTTKISGQWIDFYLSDNGYAKIDPEKDIPLAKEVPVDRSVVKWNVTFIVPDNIAPGIWYLKATDDGGASVAVSASITVSVPPKVTIVSWDDGDNIIKKGEKFNVTITFNKDTEPSVVHLNFFLLKNRVYKWINVTDVVWTTAGITENNNYIDVDTESVKTGVVGNYWRITFNATLVDFAPEFFDDEEGLGFYYVIAYLDGIAAGTTLKVEPSIELSASSANVEGTITITGHNFPYKTTVLESTWAQIGTDVYIYLVKLIPPAGASKLLKVWEWLHLPNNVTVSSSGTFTIANFVIPPLQGGGKDVTIEAFAFSETDEPEEGGELVKASAAFALIPDVKVVYEASNSGSWTTAGKLSPGDWIKIEAKGLITSETLKVFLYNTTAGDRKKLAELPIVASDIENDGNATIVVQLPPTISYVGVNKIKVFINGTTDSNYAATSDITIPDDTRDSKVFINPVVKLDKIEFDIAKDNEVGVASFKIVLIGIMNPSTPSKYADVANVTLYGKDTGYEYVLGLKELTNGYYEFTFVLPEIPYDIKGYEAWVNKTNNYASSYAVIPVNATLYIEPNFVYSTTAEVTITGKGFEAGKAITVWWDGVLPWVTVETDEKGTFTVVKKIPGAAPGLHVVTADAPTGQTRTPTAYVTIQTPPVKAFTVSVKVGQVYMTGETAEVHILTSFNGKPVEPAELKAELWFNSDPELLESLGFGKWDVPVKLDVPSEYISKVDDGWYVIKLPLVIKKDTRMPWLGVPGVYTVKVVAAYAFGEEYKLYDTQLATFTISPMLRASVLEVLSLGAGQQTILAQLASLTEVVMKIDATTAEIKDLVVSKSGEILAELKAFKSEVTLKLSGLPEEMTKLLEPKIKSIVETASGDLKAVIETKFGTVTKSLSDLGAKIDKVEGTVVTISTALGTVKTDLASLIKDVKTDLASGQVEIKTALGDIKGKVDDISGTVATIKTDVGTLKVELPSKVASALKATLDEIKSGISDVKSSVGAVKGSVDTAKSDIAKKVEDTAKTVADKVGEISGTLTAYGVIIIILVIITLALTAFTGLKKKP